MEIEYNGTFIFSFSIINSNNFNMGKEVMKKYSSIQRWDILPNKYRVKNYINKKWEYIKYKKVYGNCANKWIFKGISFSNSILLNKYLKRVNFITNTLGVK